MSTWIKRTEREPGISDLPIVTGYRYDTDGWQQSAWFCVPPKTSDSPYTHWRSIKADPPPRELSQREKDEEAYGKWCSNPNLAHNMNWAWHAALTYRDKQISELARYYGQDPCIGSRDRFMDALYKLCGGTNK